MIELNIKARPGFMMTAILTGLPSALCDEDTDDDKLFLLGQLQDTLISKLDAGYMKTIRSEGFVECTMSTQEINTLNEIERVASFIMFASFGGEHKVYAFDGMLTVSVDCSDFIDNCIDAYASALGNITTTAAVFSKTLNATDSPVLSLKLATMIDMGSAAKEFIGRRPFEIACNDSPDERFEAYSAALTPHIARYNIRRFFKQFDECIRLKDAKDENIE